MSDWEYCDTIERISGEGIKVLEHNPEKNMYRERTYEARDGLDEIKGEVYE